ncbi:MAG: hypothetical protein OXC14_07230, partial [Rhodospirillaceae bacterium]|nr:hypothetical protein [Rhodospirillaceae bacterium]
MTIDALTGYQLRRGFIWLETHAGFRWPFHDSHIRFDPTDNEVITREYYESLDWNPPWHLRPGGVSWASAYSDPVIVTATLNPAGLPPEADPKRRRREASGFRVLYHEGDKAADLPEWTKNVRSSVEVAPTPGWSTAFPVAPTKPVWAVWRAHYSDGASALPEYQQRDPEASPQPDWGAFVKAARRGVLEFGLVGSGDKEQSLAADVINAAATVPIEHFDAKGQVHILPTGGISHLAAMVHQRSEVMRAGAVWPLSIVHDEHGNELELWTEVPGQEIVKQATDNEVIAESAGNVLRGNLLRLRRLAEDPNGGLDDTATDDEKLTARETALTQWQAALDNFWDDLGAAVTASKVRAAGLPDDFEEAKRRLIHLLEGLVTAKVQDLLNAAGQQGMDLSASCRDQGNALQKISQIKQDHQILIERADDVEDAKGKLVLAKTALDELDVDQTPNWYSNRGRIL